MVAGPRLIAQEYALGNREKLPMSLIVHTVEMWRRVLGLIAGSDDVLVEGSDRKRGARKSEE